ncbi:14025_t:CDS:1, partial [Ambispora leptoticha]
HSASTSSFLHVLIMSRQTQLIESQSRVPNLPSECITEILKSVPSEDISTLFTCLLINRQWCLNTVRMLWYDPFGLLLAKRGQTTSSIEDWRLRVASLLNTYISFLENEDRQTLHQHKIVLPKRNSKSSIDYVGIMQKINVDQILDGVHCWYALSRAKAAQMQSFAIKTIDYNASSKNSHKFLNLVKLLNLFFHNSVRNVKKQRSDGNGDNGENPAHFERVASEHLITLIMLKLFVRRCESLKVFGIENIRDSFSLETMLIHLNSSTNLSNLVEFICVSKVPGISDILSSLAQISRRLKKIKIWQYPIFTLRSGSENLQLSSLIQLITAQKSLEELDLGYLHPDLDLNTICDAIASQSKT